MRRTGIALLSALLLGLTITGCGTEKEDDGVASLDEGAADADTSEGEDDASLEEQALAFAECMRDNGVDMPDPQVNGDGDLMMRGGGEGPGEIDERALEEAMEACEDLRPERGGDISPEDEAEMQDRMLAFAECMREHGIDMPDPDFDGGLVQFGPPEGVDPDDPAFAEAHEACQDEVGMPGDMERAP